MARRKADTERRVGALNVRLSPKEREAFERAADEKGISVGAWLRMVGLIAAGERLASVQWEASRLRAISTSIAKLDAEQVLKVSE